MKQLKTAWEKNGSKTKGTWSEVFGIGDDADLFFMAWNYSRYVNTIAEAGKKEYNLPMFANCWMPQPRPNPGKPGNYPSGGPIVSVLDVWKAGAPSVDMLAPDIYGADFKDQSITFTGPIIPCLYRKPAQQKDRQAGHLQNTMPSVFLHSELTTEEVPCPESMYF